METKAGYDAQEGEDRVQVRDARTQKRFFVDNVIIRGYGPTLGVYGVAVYAALCMHAKKETQECFPAHKTIARQLACSATKVRQAIRQLEELKLIAIQARYDPKTERRTSNLYILLEPPSHHVPPVTTDTLPSYAEEAPNNPYSDQSSLNKRGADAPDAPESDSDDLWPERDAVSEEEASPPTNPAQERLERMRAKFGDTPGDMILNCHAARAREGAWTVPHYRDLSPQCAVYRRVYEFSPKKYQRKTIDECVGADEESLQFWEQVCQAWGDTGWSPTNIKGMLDHYVLGEMPGTTKPNAGSGRGGSSGPRQVSQSLQDKINAAASRPPGTSVNHAAISGDVL